MSKIETTAGRARVRDGTGIAYTLHRNADSDRRAVLVHSLAMDQKFWKLVAEQLVHRTSILLYDCRGHGESDKPRGEYSGALFADDLADLLAHVGWNSALVAGASMGGAVAIQFAGTYPERTSGLGLIDTTAWYGPNAPKDWEARAERALKNGLEELVEFQTTRWFSSAYLAAKPEIVRQCVQTFLRNDVQAYAQTCRMLGAFDGRESDRGFQDADRHRRRRGRLRDAARHGRGHARFDSGLDAHRDTRRAASDADRVSRTDCGRIGPIAGPRGTTVMSMTQAGVLPAPSAGLGSTPQLLLSVESNHPVFLPLPALALERRMIAHPHSCSVSTHSRTPYSEE